MKHSSLPTGSGGLLFPPENPTGTDYQQGHAWIRPEKPAAAPSMHSTHRLEAVGTAAYLLVHGAADLWMEALGRLA